MKPIKLSCIIPAYNESRRIGSTLEAIVQYLSAHNQSFEIIVVDDGSTDNTVKIVNDFVQKYSCIRIISSKKNFGKGHAIKSGMLHAAGRYRFFTDADLSTPINELSRFIELLKRGVDIVIGTRKNPHAHIEKHQPYYREFLGKGFTWLSNKILGTSYSDFTCGFKLFSDYAAKKIFTISQINDWSFDAEILFLAKLLNFNVTELPVTWRNEPATKVKLIRDIINSFLGLLKIRHIHKDIIKHYD